jgi:hypothetical protein
VYNRFPACHCASKDRKGRFAHTIRPPFLCSFAAAIKQQASSVSSKVREQSWPIQTKNYPVMDGYSRVRRCNETLQFSVFQQRGIFRCIVPEKYDERTGPACPNRTQASAQAKKNDKMPQEPKMPNSWGTDPGLAEEIIARADDDIVFVLKFLGESQHRVNRHFQNFIESELKIRGVDRESYGLLQVFIDTHAAELREFVFTGVSLARQFRLREFEELLADKTSVFRTDIWDALSRYIKAAEENFQAQAHDLPELLIQMESTAPPKRNT